MKQKMQKGALDEAAQLKIYGGVSSSTNSHIKIYITSNPQINMTGKDIM